MEPALCQTQPPGGKARQLPQTVAYNSRGQPMKPSQSREPQAEGRLLPAFSFVPKADSQDQSPAIIDVTKLDPLPA